MLRLAPRHPGPEAWSSWASRGFCRTRPERETTTGRSASVAPSSAGAGPVTVGIQVDDVGGELAGVGVLLDPADVRRAGPAEDAQVRAVLEADRKRARYARSTSSLSRRRRSTARLQLVGGQLEHLAGADHHRGPRDRLAAEMSSAPRKRRSPCTWITGPSDLAEVPDDRDGTRDDDEEVVARVTRPVQHHRRTERRSLPLEPASWSSLSRG